MIKTFTLWVAALNLFCGTWEASFSKSSSCIFCKDVSEPPYLFLLELFVLDLLYSSIGWLGPPAAWFNSSSSTAMWFVNETRSILIMIFGSWIASSLDRYGSKVCFLLKVPGRCGPKSTSTYTVWVPIGRDGAEALLSKFLLTLSAEENCESLNTWSTCACKCLLLSLIFAECTIILLDWEIFKF